MATHNDNSIDAQGLGFLIADVARLLRMEFQQRMEGKKDLTLAQARALVHVSRTPGIRQVELAERLEIKPITLARLIDQLQDNNLVERRPDPSDRRAYQLHPTKQSQPHIKEIGKVIDAMRDEVLGDLNEKEVNMVFGALEKIRGKLSRSKA